MKINKIYFFLSDRDDVEWTEEQSEQANEIISTQYQRRMATDQWGL